MTHHLKTWPEYYRAVEGGRKTFEIRQNDRDFQAGDTLFLQEYDPHAELFTGRVLVRNVIYVTTDPRWVKEGFCVMGIAPP